MQRYLVLAFFCLFNVSLAHSSIFSIVDDFNLFKSEVNNKIANQHNEYSAFKVDTMGSLANLKAQIGDINVKLNTNANAVAGVNNKISTISSGRDTNQTKTTTNDTGLIKEMINSYRAVIVLLIGQLCVLLKMFINNDRKRDEWTEKYIMMLSKGGGDTNG